jgi:hypothetical protein
MGLLCPSCRFDNDSTRVFCHNCGIRLKRGGHTPAPPTGFTTPAEVAAFKTKRRPVPWGQYLGAFLRLVILGGLAAVVVLAFIPPHDVPPAVAPDPDLMKRVTALIDDSSTADSVRSFSVPSSDVQVWLSSGVTFKSSVGGMFSMEPERIYAVPADNMIRVGLIVRLPLDVPLYFEADYVPVRQADGYRLEAKRSSMGRLPLPPLVQVLVSRQLEGIAGALSGPLGQLSRASHIAVTPQKITLRWGGRQP